MLGYTELKVEDRHKIIMELLFLIPEIKHSYYSIAPLSKLLDLLKSASDKDLITVRAAIELEF